MNEPRENQAAEDGKKQKVLRIALPVIILAVGVGGFFALGSRTPKSERQNVEETTPSVETVALRAHKGGLQIEVDGIVVPYREITLSAEVAGKIDFKADDDRGESSRAGRYVAKGTPLMRIDPRDYDLEVKRITKERDQAERALEELKVQVDNTQLLVDLSEQELELQRREFRRLQTLARDQVITTSQLEQEERKVINATNALTTLNNQMQLLKTTQLRLQQGRDSANLRLQKAQLDLDRTDIVSPVDGVIVKDMVDQDEYVNKGVALVTIEDTSAVEIKCSLQMDELYWLWNQNLPAPGKPTPRAPQLDYQIPAAPVKVIYHLAGLDFVWQGVLARYDGIGLDQATRTAPCRVVVRDPRAVTVEGACTEATCPTGPPALVRGMFVTLKIHADPQQPLFLVPESVVRPGNKIWRVREGKLDMMEVRVAAVLTERLLKREVLENDALQRQAFQQGALTETLKARLSGDRKLDDPLQRRLFRPQVLRNKTLRSRFLENAAIVMPIDGERLAAGDRIVISPLAAPKNGMVVDDGPARDENGLEEAPET